MTDWRNVSLLGIDVGYSEVTDSTGIAIYDQGKLAYLDCVSSLPVDRQRVLADHRFDTIAIDGPILPLAADGDLKRNCESLLIGRGFYNRCKPGMSHYGRGLEFRRATAPFVDDIKKLAGPMPARFGNKQIRSLIPLVEAFPNAFLGVMLNDTDYNEMGKISRGQKSDIFYSRLAANNAFDKIFDTLRWSEDALRNTLYQIARDRSRKAHDKRAALICLLTAACAYSGTAEYVGDAAGGWICLPPKHLWAQWALDALSDRRTKLAKRLL